MAKRQEISASLRWSVFARDGFTCRYCGAQAGQDGVDLAVDHIVSVADGGDNRLDNLATACRKCNGGKGARSLAAVPIRTDVIDRAKAMAGNASDLADAMQQQAEAVRQMRQAIVDVKCAAYFVKATQIGPQEMGMAIKLAREFGLEMLADWYAAAAAADVGEKYAIRYVCGCARNAREASSR